MENLRYTVGKQKGNDAQGGSVPLLSPLAGRRCRARSVRWLQEAEGDSFRSTLEIKTEDPFTLENLWDLSELLVSYLSVQDKVEG